MQGPLVLPSRAATGKLTPQLSVSVTQMVLRAVVTRSPMSSTTTAPQHETPACDAARPQDRHTHTCQRNGLARRSHTFMHARDCTDLLVNVIADRLGADAKAPEVDGGGLRASAEPEPPAQLVGYDQRQRGAQHHDLRGRAVLAPVVGQLTRQGGHDVLCKEQIGLPMAGDR